MMASTIRPDWGRLRLTGPIQTGTAFYITVDPAQVADCVDLIFKDGLDYD